MLCEGRVSRPMECLEVTSCLVFRQPQFAPKVLLPRRSHKCVFKDWVKEVLCTLALLSIHLSPDYQLLHYHIKACWTPFYQSAIFVRALSVKGLLLSTTYISKLRSLPPPRCPSIIFALMAAYRLVIGAGSVQKQNGV